PPRPSTPSKRCYPGTLAARSRLPAAPPEASPPPSPTAPTPACCRAQGRGCRSAYTGAGVATAGVATRLVSTHPEAAGIIMLAASFVSTGGFPYGPPTALPTFPQGAPAGPGRNPCAVPPSYLDGCRCMSLPH